jgi:phospholipase C
VGGTIQSLNHIIIFAQENRSFDHYFGYMRQYWANNGIPDQSFDGLPQFNPASGIAPLQGPAPALQGCNPTNPDGTDVCAPDTSVTVTSYHFQSVCQEEMSPFWNEAHRDWDLNDPTGVGETQGLNNGFVVTDADDARQYYLPVNDLNGLRSMGYYDGTDLNYYYFMASNFATSDRWFSPLMDRTQINRMYLLAATSAGNVYPLGEGSAPSGQIGNTTIFEELQNAGITWKIYVNPANTVNTQGQSCSTLTGTDLSACLVENSYINQFTYEETILNSPTLLANIAPISQFAIDAQSDATMPQVALIEPASPAGLDEHPSDADDYPVDVQDGANYASQQINTLMTSAVWYDSAMIFTYDEFGGQYDHVSPQPVPAPDSVLPTGLEPGDICDASGDIPSGTCNFQWTGYRVPMIVISPFAQKNFVSHVVRDYTAILNLIEERFNVPALTARDAYWSTSAAGTNPPATMDEFFDFVNIPWATPPTPPAQTIYPSSSCNLGVPVTTGSP